MQIEVQYSEDKYIEVLFYLQMALMAVYNTAPHLTFLVEIS